MIIQRKKLQEASSVEQRRLHVAVKVNVKVKLSPFLTKHHAMKTYWGMEV
jgi:hypothetical protein